MKTFDLHPNILGLAAFTLLCQAMASQADTQLIAWGQNTSGQNNVPPGLTNVVAMAGGDGHVLALLADGNVVAWGQNDHGQATVPPDATNVYAIAAGSTHSVALRTDGTVRFWGNVLTQNITQAPTEAGANMTDLALGPGALHVLQLRAGGTVLDWGNNSVTNVPASVTNVVQVAAGSYYGLALRSSGTVVGWPSGQINVSPIINSISAIASGWVMLSPCARTVPSSNLGLPTACQSVQRTSLRSLVEGTTTSRSEPMANFLPGEITWRRRPCPPV